MRILGIDPGLQLTGYGCVDVRARSREPALVEAGVLRLKARASLAFRLAQLKDDLDALLDELRPEVMVVEKLFSHYRHARTAIIMGHARGVVLLAGEERGIRLEELAPTEIKRAVTGHGHASKMQMQRAVMTQCGLKRVPQPPDVADAIAIALCAARRLVAVTTR
jgi:crossover junction endodeoxyribonuclease RuvC